MQQEIAPFLEQWIQSATHKANPMSRLTARLIGIHHDDPKDESKDVSVLSIRKFAAEVLGQVGGAIGGGNQDVFRHIAPPFAKLIALCAGQLDEAAERLAVIRRDISATGERAFEPDVIRLEGEVARLRGDREDARELFTRARDLARATGALAYVSRAEESLAALDR